ncbi:MAG: RNA polymerase sigma factor [Acidobacteria bacterium]|nr:RNA polymerase sigma factor [Acidobacteriota bacterium]
MDSCVNALGCLVPAGAGGEAGSTGVDNRQLIRAAQQGDAAAFAQLVHQYDRAVLRVAVHLTGSTEDGQDIFQEAFLRAYIKLPRFRFECSFYTWIYRIVTNLCLDHLRKKRLHSRYSTTVSSPDGQELDVSAHVPDDRVISSPERSFAVRVLRKHIARALETLSPRERMVFELKHYHGMQLKTVAGILNTTEGTAKNTLFRATHKLRAQLAGVR